MFIFTKFGKKLPVPDDWTHEEIQEFLSNKPNAFLEESTQEKTEKETERETQEKEQKETEKGTSTKTLVERENKPKQTKCSKHESYKGLRKPRNGCAECFDFYTSNKQIGIKETRSGRK